MLRLIIIIPVVQWNIAFLNVFNNGFKLKGDEIFLLSLICLIQLPVLLIFLSIQWISYPWCSIVISPSAKMNIALLGLTLLHHCIDLKNSINCIILYCFHIAVINASLPPDSLIVFYVNLPSPFQNSGPPWVMVWIN